MAIAHIDVSTYVPNVLAIGRDPPGIRATSVGSLTFAGVPWYDHLAMQWDRPRHAATDCMAVGLDVWRCLVGSAQGLCQLLARALASLHKVLIRLKGSQRSQQLVRGVRRAFFPTITVTDSESLLLEIPELPNLEGPSAE
jgi:hypothetical protein